MASDFGDATFPFKIDPAFNFEMNDKVQIDASAKGKSWKRLAQHLVIWPKSTQSMKGFHQIHWPIHWLAWAAQNPLSFFWWTLNEILNN